MTDMAPAYRHAGRGAPLSKPEKRGPKPRKAIKRGHRPRVRLPNALGDYRARLKYGLTLWTKLIRAKEPSGLCPRCLKRPWHDAAHCWTRGGYPLLSLEIDNGAPLCRVCHRRVDSDHHAKTEFFVAYIGPDKYERLRLRSMARCKRDLGLTIISLEAEMRDRGLA